MDDLLHYIGGLPFVSENFDPHRLAGLTAFRRAQLARPPLEHFPDYLLPEVARRIYAHRARELGLEFPLTALTRDQSAAVREVTTEIVAVMPTWAPLYELPREYLALEGDETSATCALVPQSIFLGQLAFGSRDTLLESVIHENAHLWLDLLIEVGDCQTKSDRTVYDLPSGTPNKTLTGVLLAAHFATTTRCFYLRRQRNSGDRRRGDYLSQYGARCLKRIAGRDGLTELGKRVWQDLWNALDGDRA